MFTGCLFQIRITNSLMNAFKGCKDIDFKLADMQQIKPSHMSSVCVSNAILTTNPQLCLWFCKTGTWEWPGETSLGWFNKKGKKM